MLEFAERIDAEALDPQVETPEEARYRAVAQAIDELRPHLQRDGGDCHLSALRAIS